MSARQLFTDIPEGECLKGECSCYKEHGDEFNCFDILDLDWISSSGNSCEEETYDRSSLVSSPIDGSLYGSVMNVIPLENAGYLVAVLRLGGRGARYSAAKALENLFSPDQHVRNAESARQAVQPLVEVLNAGMEKEQHVAVAALLSLLQFCAWVEEVQFSPDQHVRNAESAHKAVQPLVEVAGMEKEQHVAVAALIRLLSENPLRALAVADVELNALDVLCKILSSDSSRIDI